jgi:hypothetical protein
VDYRAGTAAPAPWLARALQLARFLRGESRAHAVGLREARCLRTLPPRHLGPRAPVCPHHDTTMASKKRANKNIRADVRSYRIISQGSKPKVEFQLMCCFKTPTLEKSVVTWEVWKRFSEFAELDAVLRKKWVEVAAKSFPAKKVFGALDPAFLDKRLAQLSEWIQSLLTIDNIGDFHKPHICSNELRLFMNFDKGSQPKEEKKKRGGDDDDADPSALRSDSGKTAAPRGGASRTARAGRRRSSISTASSKSKNKADPYANATDYVTADAPAPATAKPAAAAAPAPAPAPTRAPAPAPAPPAPAPAPAPAAAKAGPPPPPPPPAAKAGPPPPPPPAAVRAPVAAPAPAPAPSGGGDEDVGGLLAAIRGGAKLKKASHKMKDRSAPLI